MATVEGSNKKIIILKSLNGEEFEVEEAIRHMIENGIPLPDVKSYIFSKAIENRNKHVQAEPARDATVGDVRASIAAAPAAAENLENWSPLSLAAKYLKGLLHLTCQIVADMMRDTTPVEIPKIFNIKTEYTPKKEDEEEIRRDN